MAPCPKMSNKVSVWSQKVSAKDGWKQRSTVTKIFILSKGHSELKPVIRTHSLLPLTSTEQNIFGIF